MSPASIVYLHGLPHGLSIAPCVCDDFIHGENVPDAEYGAHPHLRAGREEVRQCLVQGVNTLHAIFEGIEPEEIDNHDEDGELSDTVEHIEALDYF